MRWCPEFSKDNFIGVFHKHAFKGTALAGEVSGCVDRADDGEALLLAEKIIVPPMAGGNMDNSGIFSRPQNLPQPPGVSTSLWLGTWAASGES